MPPPAEEHFGRALLNAGNVLLKLGQHDDAAAALEDSLEVLQAIGAASLSLCVPRGCAACAPMGSCSVACVCPCVCLYSFLRRVPAVFQFPPFRLVALDAQVWVVHAAAACHTHPPPSHPQPPRASPLPLPPSPRSHCFNSLFLVHSGAGRVDKARQVCQAHVYALASLDPSNVDAIGKLQARLASLG